MIDGTTPQPFTRYAFAVAKPGDDQGRLAIFDNEEEARQSWREHSSAAGYRVGPIVHLKIPWI